MKKEITVLGRYDTRTFKSSLGGLWWQTRCWRSPYGSTRNGWATAVYL